MNLRARVFSLLDFAMQSTLILSVATLHAAEHTLRESLQKHPHPRCGSSCPHAAHQGRSHDHTTLSPHRCICLEALARRIDPRRM
jgi:hypothetical protein